MMSAYRRRFRTWTPLWCASAGLTTLLVGCILPALFELPRILTMPSLLGRAPLDLTPWSVVEFAGPFVWVHSFADHTATQHRSGLPFSDGQIFQIGGSANDDGLLATATSDNVIRLFQLGSSDVLVERDMGAQVLGLAWSSQGDRLGILVREEGETDESLLVTTAELERVAELAVDLRPAEISQRYIVSWSADDTQVAVSNNRTSALTLTGDCVIMGVDDASRHRLPLSNVYFVGNNLIVGTTSGTEIIVGDSAFFPAVEQLRGFQLDGGQVVRDWQVPGVFAAASRPKDGGFAVWLQPLGPLGSTSLRFFSADASATADIPGVSARDLVALFGGMGPISIIPNDR